MNREQRNIENAGGEPYNSQIMPEVDQEGQQEGQSTMRQRNGEAISTIFEEGPIDRERIRAAVSDYFGGLRKLAFPPEIPYCPLLPQGVEKLEPIFLERVDAVIPEIVEIIAEINERNQILKSQEFADLQQKDRSFWQDDENPEAVLFGILACVDKGIPQEAVIGVDGAMGRTLGGDIQISFSPSSNEGRGAFFPEPSVLSKRLIHNGRQNRVVVEPQEEHIGCGRRQQLLNNEGQKGDIPSIGKVMKNALSLMPEFTGDEQTIRDQLSMVQNMWNSLERKGDAVVAPDGGAWAGIMVKIAQRQALEGLEEIDVVSPIEIYDKRNGNLVVGVDSLDVLTDERVQMEQGFTDNVIEALSQEGKIFSMKHHFEKVAQLLEKHGPLKKGTHTYEDLQNNWLAVQNDLVEVTGTLWQMYESDQKAFAPVRAMIDQYLQAALSQITIPEDIQDLRQTIEARLIHHMLHSFAYAYTLDTFERGNVPGHHIETHSASGDHDMGAKRYTSLGQGDIERPSAAEMFTEYLVLMHSVPGEEGAPVVHMVKLDTERRANETMTDEETSVAINDFNEFLKLWPYMMVGDIIPALVIRGKLTGGVSRLALSVVLSFQSIVKQLELDKHPLPRLTYANNSAGEVVLVPATAILQAGIEAEKDLRLFRKKTIDVADQFSDSAVQVGLRAEYAKAA